MPTGSGRNAKSEEALLSDLILEMKAREDLPDLPKEGAIAFLRNPAFENGPELIVTLQYAMADETGVYRIECGWLDLPVYILNARVPLETDDDQYNAAVEKVVDKILAFYRTRLLLRHSGVYVQEESAKRHLIDVEEVILASDDGSLWWADVLTSSYDRTLHKVIFTNPPSELNEDEIYSRIVYALHQMNLTPDFYEQFSTTVKIPADFDDLRVSVTAECISESYPSVDLKTFKVFSGPNEEIKAAWDLYSWPDRSADSDEGQSCECVGYTTAHFTKRRNSKRF